MEVAITCLQILTFLNSVYMQMSSNSAEALRLIDRVGVFKEPLNALILQQQQGNAAVFQTKQNLDYVYILSLKSINW